MKSTGSKKCKKYESDQKKTDDDEDESEDEGEAELEKVKEGAIKDMLKCFEDRPLSCLKTIFIPSYRPLCFVKTVQFEPL